MKLQLLFILCLTLFGADFVYCNNGKNTRSRPSQKNHIPPKKKVVQLPPIPENVAAAVKFGRSAVHARNINTNGTYADHFDFQGYHEDYKRKIIETAISAYADEATQIFAGAQAGAATKNLIKDTLLTLVPEARLQKELTGIMASSVNPFRILNLYEEHNERSFFNDPLSPPHTFHFRVLAENIHYCDQVDMNNLVNPDNWLNHKYYFTDWTIAYFKSFLNYELDNTQGNLRYNGVHARRLQELSTNVTMFYQYVTDYEILAEVGLRHTCFTQTYMTVPGTHSLSSKDEFTTNFYKYAEKYREKQSCLETEAFFPRSFLLLDADQCKAFFELLQSDEYQDAKDDFPIQYLLKIGTALHKKRGVFLLDEEREQRLLFEYSKGEMCGENKRNLIAQRYITNPLLIHGGHKFDFRIHVLIASTNPLQVYYHDGFVRTSLQEYDPTSKDVRTHLTNVRLSEAIARREKDQEKRDQLKRIQHQLLEEFQRHLLEEGVIESETWLEDYLRPAFKKAIAHIIRMSKHSFATSSGAFRLFGFDFVMDKDLKVWFIDVNEAPIYLNAHPESWNLYKKMIHDMIEIEYAMLRSRITRVRQFMVEFMKEYIIPNQKYDKEELRKKFFELNLDVINSKFSVSPGNGWQPVVNLVDGESRNAYFNLLDETCFETE